MEEYDQDEWKDILKSYAKLEASVNLDLDLFNFSNKVTRIYPKDKYMSYQGIAP